MVFLHAVVVLHSLNSPPNVSISFCLNGCKSLPQAPRTPTAADLENILPPKPPASDPNRPQSRRSANARHRIHSQQSVDTIVVKDASVAPQRSESLTDGKGEGDCSTMVMGQGSICKGKEGEGEWSMVVKVICMEKEGVCEWSMVDRGQGHLTEKEGVGSRTSVQI